MTAEIIAFPKKKEPEEVLWCAQTEIKYTDSGAEAHYHWQILDMPTSYKK